MAVKKQEETEVAETKRTFTKYAILHSVKYGNRRDLLGVLLEDGKEYTVSEVDNEIKKYMSGGNEKC